MNPTRPPGWYADPDGVPGRLRWWDGSAWADMTLPGPPRHPAGAAASPAGAAGRPPPRPVPGAARRWARLAVPTLAAGLLVTVAVTALPHGGPAADHGAAPRWTPYLPTPTAPPAPAVPPTAVPPTAVPPTAVPPTAVPPQPAPPSYTATRVVDPAAGLSYLRPPGTWQVWDPNDMLLFGLGTAGVYQVTQHGLPGGGEQRAEFVSGPLLPVVAYRGPTDLPAAGTQLAESLEHLYYPDHTRRTLAQRPTTVDGHPAYLVRFDVTFDPRTRGYDARSAAVAVVVVDTGRPAPGVLYASLPDTRRALWPEIDRVVGSLAVVR